LEKGGEGKRGQRVRNRSVGEKSQLPRREGNMELSSRRAMERPWNLKCGEKKAAKSRRSRLGSRGKGQLKQLRSGRGRKAKEIISRIAPKGRA